MSEDSNTPRKRSSSPVSTGSASEKLSDVLEKTFNKQKDALEKTIQKQKEALERTIQKQKELLKRQADKIMKSKEVKKMARGIEKLSRKDEEPKFLKNLDKVTYCYGIISVLMTFALMFYPRVKVYAYWVVLKNALLIFIRFVKYRIKGWHYYFFDYCYYVNFFLWAYLILFPQSKFLFIMVYMNSFSPLLNYFVVFKPKLIFHNIESITSFLMHFSPSLILLVLRYFNWDDESPFPQAKVRDKWEWDNAPGNALTFIAIGCSFYFAWCTTYYLLVFVILKGRIERKGNLTLYEYAVKDNGSYNNIILRFGEDKGPIAYILLHATFGLAGNLMSLCFMYSKTLTILALFGYILFPVWFSSNYYFDYFSADYVNKLEKRALVNKEKRLRRGRSSSADDIKTL